MVSLFFVCENIGIGGRQMLFNLWNFTPGYLSASDGVIIEEMSKSMEEPEHAISEPVFPTIPISICAEYPGTNG